MAEQISIEEYTEIMRSEKIIASIRPQLDAVLESFNLSPRHIAESPLTEKGKQVGISLLFAIAPSSLSDSTSTASTARSHLICRIKDQVTQSFIEFPADREKYYSQVGKATKVGAAPQFLRINLEKNPNLFVISRAICSDIDSFLRLFPSDFSCCHLYKECSKAGKCIANDQDFACGCYYKRNLMAGNIFY